MELQYIIDRSERYGGADGYVVASKQEQVRNYLSEYTDSAAALAAWLQANCARVGILKNLNVDEDERGNGYGNSLLEDFLDESERYGANVVILIADTCESQQEGFVLTAWYEGYGFVQVAPTNAGPLMVYPEDVGERLLDHLRANSPVADVQPH